MCILFIAIDQHPDYPVIIAANRDEFKARPTSHLQQWPEGIIAGKDLQAGGTWLGVNQQGHFSALTNIRQPQKPDFTGPSRGELPLYTLSNSIPQSKQYLLSNAPLFQGFNLVFGHINELYRFNSNEQQIQPLTAGIHAVCNGPLNTDWPKMSLGKQLLQQVLAKPTLPIEQLWSILANKQQAQDQHLPQTGVPYQWEKVLSSIYIEGLEYGTRASSLILLDRQNILHIYERSDVKAGDSSFTIAI
ncbi:NRDE family protein [Paraferrimonas sp. SM1919]|uniref:NRDE family protein n=1 Tax=Paraferrimonas sp. SM1919 TaxID=2662263 RepID=UPI0013CFAA4C|nr:NRDE family protein [Paraferrimonas sp. SM1919]